MFREVLGINYATLLRVGLEDGLLGKDVEIWIRVLLIQMVVFCFYALLR